MSCDCYLGSIFDISIYNSNINKVVLNEVEMSEYNCENYKGIFGEPHTVKSLTDGRKGNISRFNFCPMCGTKIEWKKIINEIK